MTINKIAANRIKRFKFISTSSTQLDYSSINPAKLG